ncbi:glycosyltransferase family 4 protein [Campylobacter fetus]|uniref:glycosyltransferase family 4 protein n=1 Tax=Campylobacter fetus TaxID=196 RepID=UPI000818ADDD|nr:glycosyltransferase family 4 protein [Campylobacter fetus]EAH8300231.1 glycosyltransferase [Campylobacter fetus]EAI7232697.1 glycosyltransferase family 4 protein [Campylobacter fetus]EAJ5690472.1 glycosyltransferase family 4 protein [Campylobacter fetus]EAK0428474.1 glycosyltransferase family 4 protein [Campylobacter fetus]EAK5304378.1 glycosyltransferase family 4 protein [Campylobacter fetus]
MKKIVFLRTDPSATGGAERYLTRLKNALKNSGINSEIRSFKGNKKLSSWLKALKFNAQVKNEKNEDEIYFSLDRVTSADIYRAGDGVHKVYRSLKPFWFFNPLNFVYVYLEKRCFLNSKSIITNSNLIKKQIIDTYGIDKDKITTIYNGINLPTKVEKGSAKMRLCEKFGLNYELPILLFVGSGFKRKGVSEFLSIISKISLAINTIIVGSDKNIKKYKNLAKKLGINAIFTGKQRVVNDFYEGADMFIFPTHYEPFSNVILEALSYGCVCITTRQNGASEILDKDFIMDQPKSFEIANFIEKILKDNKLLSKIQTSNLELSKKFSIEDNAKKTMEIINAHTN